MRQHQGWLEMQPHLYIYDASVVLAILRTKFSTWKQKLRSVDHGDIHIFEPTTVIRRL